MENGKEINCSCGQVHTDLEKAEKGETKKKVKTLTPYRLVKEYELDFKRKFAKTIGDMSNDLLSQLNKYSK